MATTIILHGYSDEGSNFVNLARFLEDQGMDVISIRLGNYLTLEDSVTIEDLAAAFETVLDARKIPHGAGDLNLVVHSTGSLVAREWLTRFYLEQNRPCPVRRYLMLAPANFGSPLAAMGKTMVGRIVKGWKSGFESGRAVLDALEMGSSYTWQLARRDLFGPRSFYDPTICMAAVLVGSKPYGTGLRKLSDENGGDGTVYVCTANLNATGLTALFGGRDDPTVVQPWPRTAQPIAFGVFPDRDHTSIKNPDTGTKVLGRTIARFLQLQTPDDYAAFSAECDALTAATLPPNPKDEKYHTYQNLAARVTDDLGHPVRDYFLEFYEKAKSPADETKVDDLMVQIHTEVLESVHNYKPDPSHRSLLFDLTDLADALGTRKKLMFSLSAAPVSELVSYRSGKDVNDVSELAVSGKGASFWRANETLLADIVIRRQQAEKLFGLLDVPPRK